MIAPVLIVDDSLTVRMDLDEAFREAGFETVLCADAASARRVFQTRPLSLAILDILLPDGDGIELLREIRQQPSTADLPVMLLTTEVEVVDRVRGLTTGADEYVGKPYDLEHLMRRARDVVRDRALSAAVRSRTRVVLVDDSPAYCELMRQALEAAGYEVLVAGGGEEGLRMVAEHRPDAVLVDALMPGVDGPTVIRRIRSDEALGKMPCLLLTASDDPGIQLSALDAGADAFVRKDESDDVVLARLASLMRRVTPSSDPDQAPAPLAPRVLLIVDDSETFLLQLSLRLKPEGFQVIQARSGREALEKLAMHAVDCILLDVTMPELSGHETCRLIRTSPAWRDVPIVMLTSREDREGMIEGINSGADDYILKSADTGILKARIRAQLRRKHFEDENRRIWDSLRRAAVEQERARAALELADTRAALLADLRNVIMENADAMLVVDDQGKVLLLNPATRALFGTQADRFTESGFPHAWSVGDRREIEIEDPGKPSRFAEMRVTRVEWQGQSCFLITLRDLTDRKRTEQALAHSQKMSAVAVIASGVAHHFNNILMIIQGHAYLGKTETSREDSSWELFDTIIRATSRAADLVHRLMTFSGSNPKTRPRAVDVASAMDAIVKMARVLIPENVRIRVRCDPGSSTVLIDQAELEQMVMNVLLNGRDAMPQGGEISIDVTNVAGSDVPAGMLAGAYVRISIGDTGCGMTAEQKAHLFEPFYTTKGPDRGVGLGLPVVFGIVSRAGGKVVVDSEPGQGTRLTVHLPLHGELPSPQAAPDETALPTSRRVNVLVVEDEAELREILVIILRKLGHTVIEAASAQEALQKAFEGTDPIELLLADIVMPGMNGQELAQALRSRIPSLKIIYMTGHSDETVNPMIGFKIDGPILRKPFGGSRLAELIEQMMADRPRRTSGSR